MVKVELDCNCKNIGSERCKAYVSSIKSLLEQSKIIPNGMYLKIQHCDYYEQLISQSQSSKSKSRGVKLSSIRPDLQSL